MKGEPLDIRAWLSRPSHEVAPDLLGWRLSHTTEGGTVTVELTEVEAYAGEADPASHAWRGPTPRNRVMYGPAGHLYVYLSHGLHVCANVVTGPEGEASAVLLRAGRVVHGAALAFARRGPVASEERLARGPGNLGNALGLGVVLSGADLLGSDILSLGEPGSLVSSARSGPRVGVSRAADVHWRFWLDSEPSVSAYRRG